MVLLNSFKILCQTYLKSGRAAPSTYFLTEAYKRSVVILAPTKTVFMYFSLLRLRSRQLKRQLAQLSFIYKILLLLIFLIVIAFIWVQFNDDLRSKFAVCCIVLSVLSVHISRKDISFILNQLPAPKQQLFAEYSILSLPFTLPCLFTHQWYFFPVLLLSFYAISHVRIVLKQRTVFPNLSKLIPITDFELLSGFRKGYALFITLYLAALATSWFPLAPVFIMWFFTISLLSCYQECESYDMLTVSSDPPGRFLIQKIRRHYFYLFILTLPVILVQTIIHPSYIWVTLLLLVVQLALVTLGIAFKYSNYEPRQQLDTGNLLLFIIAGSSMIPFLLPLPLLFALKYFRSAKANLNNYLYDQQP